MAGTALAPLCSVQRSPRPGGPPMFRDTSAQDVPLSGGAARRRRLPWVAAAAAEARVVAAVSPTLYAPNPGTVSLKVHAGDQVQSGQVLASLDSPDLSSRLAQEQAALAGLE